METWPESKQFYPFVTRMLLELATTGVLTEVSRIEVEPQFGFVSRINYLDGSVRLTRGGDVGFNSSAVNAVLSDKVYTKYLLGRSGFRSPDGRPFLLPWWAETIRNSLSSRGYLQELHTTADAPRYVEQELHYPVYVKPADGSRGTGVHRCEDRGALVAACTALDSPRHKLVVVEEAIAWPDYRLVVLDGAVISAYRRDRLAIVGTGTATVAELAQAHLAEEIRNGRSVRIDLQDPRILAALSHTGLDLQSTPAHGRRVELLPISNLSAGGTAVDVGVAVDGRWTRLAIDIADALGAVLCGVDLACEDITAADAGYCVIEVNGSPGLDNYAQVGPAQAKVVRDLYTVIFNTSPQSSRDRRGAARHTL